MGEIPSLLEVAGATVILAGVALAMTAQRYQERTSATLRGCCPPGCGPLTKTRSSLDAGVSMVLPFRS